MRIRHLVVLLALFAAAPVTAQSTQVFHSAAAGYTLQLPGGWWRLPEAEVDLLRQHAPQQAVGNSFEAGYRVRGSRARIPMLTVATIDLGRQYSRAQFREQVAGPQARAQMQSAADGARAANGAARMGVPAWDEENGAVWTRVAHQSDGHTPPFTWSASMQHPDQRRMIVLIYTGAPGEDEARVRADLLAIVRSLRVD